MAQQAQKQLADPPPRVWNVPKPLRGSFRWEHSPPSHGITQVDENWHDFFYPAAGFRPE